MGRTLSIRSWVPAPRQVRLPPQTLRVDHRRSDGLLGPSVGGVGAGPFQEREEGVGLSGEVGHELGHSSCTWVASPL